MEAVVKAVVRSDERQIAPQEEMRMYVDAVESGAGLDDTFEPSTYGEQQPLKSQERENDKHEVSGTRD